MKQLVYVTCTKLPCIGELQAPIILCIDEEIELVSGNHTIPAFLLVSNEIIDECECSGYWRYDISYDEQLLSDPETLLVPDNVIGIFCETCFTDWIQGLIGENCLESTSTITLTHAESGCLTAFVNISEDGGNGLSIHSDGLYAESGGAGAGWALTGNAGTVDGTNFLGTIDNIPFTMRMNNTRVFRVQPGNVADRPSFLMGSSINAITAATDDNTVSGGRNNEIYQTSGGTIGGGRNNFVGDGAAGADGFSTVGGGYFNVITCTPDDSFFGYNTIAGGNNNEILDSDYCIVGGCFDNIVQNGWYDGIFSGNDNFIDGAHADFIGSNFIGGGSENLISGAHGYSNVICGGGDSGLGNQILNSFICAVLGGSDNVIQDGALGSGIGVGTNNRIEGADLYSFISGGQTNLITAIGLGFVSESDAIEASERCTITNSFNCAISASLDCTIGGLTDGTEECAIIASDESTISEGLFFSAILGGAGHTINSTGSQYEGNIICGGNQNQITDSQESIILGGQDLLISGCNSSSILGGRHFKIGSKSIGYLYETTGGTADSTAFTDIGIWGNIDTWIANTDGVARKILFFEPNTDLDFSSANYSSFKAQAQGANIEYIWPAAAGVAGNSLKIQSVVGTVVTLEWA